METVHFTDLKHLATRSNVQRGVRYLDCHDSRGRDGLLQAAYAREVLTTSNVVFLTARATNPHLTYPESDTKLHPFYSILVPASRWGEARVRWCYASDSGLWLEPGVGYMNKINYLLNINELLRQGIVIDTTPIERDPSIGPIDDYPYI